MDKQAQARTKALTADTSCMRTHEAESSMWTWTWIHTVRTPDAARLRYVCSQNAKLPDRTKDGMNGYGENVMFERSDYSARELRARRRGRDC